MSDLSLPSRAFLCVFLLTALGLTGCGASRAYESSSPATAPVEEAPASEEEESAGNTSGADGERGAEATAEAQSTPSEDEAAEDDLDLATEQDAARQEPAPASPEPGKEKEKKVRLVSNLHAELQALEESLHPKRLSCEGAKPHQDAICSIATRICEMEQPSTTKSGDCKQAEKSCKQAKQRYEEKCR